MRPSTFTAEPSARPRRLDLFLAEALAPEYSRSHVARFIRAGLVRLNGEPARSSSMVRAGDRVEITPAAPIDPPADAVDAPEVVVLFADAEVIVVNKPSGMTVHPAPGHPSATLVDGLLRRFPDLASMAEPGGVTRPGIVHRLDKDTSGVMVVARTAFSRAALACQFKERTVEKVYLAVVRGLVKRDQFTIDRPVGRHHVDRKKMSTHARHGRGATSQVRVIARFPSKRRGEFGASILSVVPRTGRTHQIRVHLASIGHPCLGDPLYGRGAGRGREKHETEFRRQALHAVALSFDHPRSGQRMRFEAPLPEDIREFLAQTGLIPDVQHLTGAGR